MLKIMKNIYHVSYSRDLAFFLNIALFVWQCRVLAVACMIAVAACRIFYFRYVGSLVPLLGIEPGSRAAGAQGLSPWTTREVPPI